MTPAARHRTRRSKPAVASPHIPPRELQVLALVSEGRTVKGAAGVLGISPWTAQNYLRSAYARLGAANQAQAVRRADVLFPGWFDDAISCSKVTNGPADSSPLESAR